MLNARERAVLARLEANLTMSWILTESWILGGPRALSSSSRAPAAAGAGFAFALFFLSRFLVANGGVEGVDILTDGSTCSVSIFRFFLGGDFASGASGGVLSALAFAFFAFAFTLASSRRAFRAWLAFFYMVEKGCWEIILELSGWHKWTNEPFFPLF